MKKILLFITISVIGTGVSAQVDTLERSEKMERKVVIQKADQEKLEDGYIFKDGRMMTVNNGLIAVMKKETTLENGTVLAINGNYTVVGRKTKMLKKDEHMDPAGLVTEYRTPEESREK